ncbi:Protein of unknown function [Pyronema omphalodes CBS 100304]|uniref:Uncharacterized protein n=1 Tax=Pyronema omphalodes (strain CBS 100304) TaxID=1076935 RepID=U4LRZ1_PYROM|nr:Protein of unknown function [Pyronema omphalodes CBS 100304]
MLFLLSGRLSMQ